MRTLPILLAALVALGCSDPVDPCSPGEPAQGVPFFDLVGSLRQAGAQVEELGQRLDQTLFSVPTQVLAVDGHEVLMWEHCGGASLRRDMGLLGIGVDAVDPPVIHLGSQDHVYAVARVVAWYVGSDPDLIDLLTEVLGPEIVVP